MACELGFEKLILKNQQLRMYFISNPESPYFESPTFKGILQYIQLHTNRAKLKQVGKIFMLVVERVKSMKEVRKLLQSMTDHSNPPVTEGGQYLAGAHNSQ